MIRILLVLLLSLACPAFAEEKVVAGLSQNRVAITADFNGTSILIFGAVKRETPPPDAGPLEVIIAVASPSAPVTVRKKSKVFGIWVNTASVEIDRAPNFYSVASTRPLSEVLNETEDLRYRISIDKMIHSVGEAKVGQDLDEFSEAIIRIRHDKDQYSQTGNLVSLAEETLFSSEIQLPSNLVEGDYTARIFLTRDKQVVDAYETSITVRKVGLERWIYNLAHEKPLIYGILSLAIAIFAGWLASTIFRVLRLN